MAWQIWRNSCSNSFLTFRGPCIVSIFLLICFQQDANLHSSFISGKLLYMFRVISPPIIRSTHNCIYSIWYLSNRYCYALPSWKSWNWFECDVGIVLICFGVVADSNRTKSIKKLRYTELWFWLLFCMGVKLGRLHWWRNAGWGCLRIGCWGEYLGLRGTRYWEWRRLYNEELNCHFSSPNIVWVVKSRWIRWAGHLTHMGEKRGAYRVLVQTLEGKRPLGRPRHRWEGNIKIVIQEVGGGHGLDLSVSE